MVKPKKLQPEELLKYIPEEDLITIPKLMKLFPIFRSYNSYREYLNILVEKGLVEVQTINNGGNFNIYLYKKKNTENGN